MPSKKDRFRPGQRLSASDMNEIVRRITNMLTGGKGNTVTRTSKQVAVTQSGHQIIPIRGTGGGSSIVNAANKASLDLVVVPAPRLGWTEDTELLYERSEDGLTWVLVSRWRPFTA